MANIINYENYFSKNTTAYKQKAFTLAELLVSILIISVILTLLAPVITKRAKESISVSTSSLNSKLYIYNKSNPECSEISGVNNSIQCLFTVPSGVKRINAIAVSGGGGGAGATQPSIEYGKKLTVANATPKTSKTQELTITNGMKNIIVSELIGSGAGGGGAAWSGSDGSPQSQAECAPYKAIFVPAAYNGTNGKNLCVTKFNVGDTGFGGPPIAAGVTTVSPYTKCSGTHCCWQGQTSDECYDTHNIDYDGCNRTACTMPAAKKSCEEWAPAGTPAGSWRL
ncbi:TPA: type II secretion system protein, partial [Candidatus Galligastranaerophilus intestinavium]|nr:type II secretion system protein [Candidatus Galligastranaerophilus intestinavium]